MGVAPRIIWVLITTVVLASAGAGGDDSRAARTIEPIVQGCPLAIGELPVRSWIAQDHRTLKVRFVPVQSDFAHCLEVSSLSLQGPGGERLQGRRVRAELSLPLRLGPSGLVTAKFDESSSARGLGLGMRIALPFGEDDRSKPLEFSYPAPRALLREESRAGWSLRGMARNICSGNRVELFLPLDRFEPCSAR